MSKEEGNETVKWREGFKSFERCRKRKRQQIMAVDKSTCGLIEGGWGNVESVNSTSVSTQSHVDRREFDFLVFSLDKPQLKTGGLVYRSGHRV